MDPKAQLDSIALLTSSKFHWDPPTPLLTATNNTKMTQKPPQCFLILLSSISYASVWLITFAAGPVN